MSSLVPSVIIFRVRKERDEVLETYLDQPFDDYCITRKELLELLRRHHNTKIALEKEKEETLRWVGGVGNESSIEKGEERSSINSYF